MVLDWQKSLMGPDSCCSLFDGCELDMCLPGGWNLDLNLSDGWRLCRGLHWGWNSG